MAEGLAAKVAEISQAARRRDDATWEQLGRAIAEQAEPIVAAHLGAAVLHSYLASVAARLLADGHLVFVQRSPGGLLLSCGAQTAHMWHRLDEAAVHVDLGGQPTPSAAPFNVWSFTAKQSGAAIENAAANYAVLATRHLTRS